MITFLRMLKPEDTPKLLEAYQSGLTLKEVAEKYSVGVDTVRRRLMTVSEGIIALKSRKYRGNPIYAFNPETKEQLYSWKSTSYASFKLGISTNRIRYALKHGSMTHGLLFSEEPELCQNK